MPTLATMPMATKAAVNLLTSESGSRKLGPIEPVGARPRQRGRALTRYRLLRGYVAELEHGGPVPLVTIVEASRARLRAAEAIGRATVADAVARSWG